MTKPPKRRGSETRTAAQQAALALFTANGYEATSLREVAEVLGITKAALYYHFRSKEDIVRAIMQGRNDEARDLRRWVDAQPPAPDLLDRTVLRWIDTHTQEKLQGVRFVTANPTVLRGVLPDSGSDLRDHLEAIIERVTGDQPSPARRLLARMAFLSINAAVSAAAGTPHRDEDIRAAARTAAGALLRELHATT